MIEKIKQNNVVTLLIPVVAVVVILESIVLVTGLTKKESAEVVEQPVEVSVAPVKEISDFNISILGSYDMTLGKSYPIEVNAVSSVSKSLDAVNLYVKYDATAFEVTNLSFDSKLPKPTFSKVSKQKNMVVVNYLISGSGGLEVKGGEALALLKFDVKPLKIGSFSFEVSTSKDSKESATMFVENTTSKALPFSGSGLNVNVLK